MDDKLRYDIHDMVVVGGYELRVREYAIGGIVIEAWRQESIGRERTLFESVYVDEFDVKSAITELWQKLCG